MIVTDWSKYPNFTKEEFNCSHTGKNNMTVEFMEKLQKLRNIFGKAIKITSGYRDPSHPSESKKAKPGTHSDGIACDIACDASTAYLIVKIAFELGFTGIGISQKNGIPRFIHLDLRKSTPVIYSY